ncbi:MAG: hypothetical protein ACTSYA_04935 [Candidatus Kariarchaeaceae archaeon]
MALEIDLGVILLGIVSGIVGSIVYFWSSVLKEKARTVTETFQSVTTELSENPDLMDKLKAGKQFVDKKDLKKLLTDRKRLVGKKRREIRRSLLDRWTIGLVMGIVASLLFILSSQLELTIGFLVGAFSSGFSADTFIEKILGKELKKIDTEEIASQIKSLV